MIESLVTYRCWTAFAFNLAVPVRESGAGAVPSDAHLPARELSLPLRVLFHILFPPTASMPRTDKLGVVFEAGRDGFAAMRVSFHKLDNLFLLFACAPCLELVQISKYECVTVVGFARAIRGLGRGRDVPSRC